MNLQKVKEYTYPAFSDLMKQSLMGTYNEDRSGPWNTKLADQLEVDENGYPLEVPASIPGEKTQLIRISLNNYAPPGEYAFLYDGEGSIRFKVPHSLVDGQDRIVMDGTGQNRWVEIDYSKKGNHIRNIRIVPLGDDGQVKESTFNPLFLQGLRSFHCIRFSTWLEWYVPRPFSWDERTTPTSISQNSAKGVAIEYIAELSNELKCDCWITIPNQVDDVFIKNFAIMIKEQLDPSLKIYLEYSNESWNPVFNNYHYLVGNAPGATDGYVSLHLSEIAEEGKDLGTKYAYMAQRVFKIWSEVFGEEASDRIIRVAATQTANPWLTGQICKFLFKSDENGQPLTAEKYDQSLGLGCDAVAGTGYFKPDNKEIEYWSTLPEEQLTANDVLEATRNQMFSVTFHKLEETAEKAHKWGCDFIAYEGGQHIVSYRNKKWPTTQALWDAQITPGMYDLYLLEFEKQASDKVKCKLFCAFDYCSKRESVFGSWGHLERLDQLMELQNIKAIAPKYAALLDVNTERTESDESVQNLRSKVPDDT